MDDERTAEGVEHLQRAAKELVAAARSFLDVVEDVVEDPDRFAATATSLIDLVRDGVGSLGVRGADAPWATNAWTASERVAQEHGDEQQPRDEEPGPDSDEQRDGGTPDRAETTQRRSPQRVRRIAVD